jgi:hypothetical protein
MAAQKHTTRRPIFIPIGPSIAYISLTQGYFCLVDVMDIELLDQRPWCAFVERKKSGLVRVCAFGGGVLMHRFLLDPESHMQIDHANGNPLDNRRGNLRVATNSQNCMNKTFRVGVSGYRGVHRDGNKWRAVLQSSSGKTIEVGRFSDPKVAHEAWLKAALEKHGDFVKLVP